MIENKTAKHGLKSRLFILAPYKMRQPDYQAASIFLWLIVFLINMLAAVYGIVGARNKAGLF